tara:strand:+ start:218 stop:640 length:423 start_codon:yes stop_codon:yes gene_type:complete
MRANISLNIDVDRVPDLVRGLLASEGTRLLKIVQAYNENIMDPLSEQDFELVIENLEDLQDILTDVNSVLAQSQNITAGYMQRDEPEEESSISKSVRERAEQAERKRGFDRFLNKINTQNVYNEPSEDQDDQEVAGEEEL